MSSKILTKFEPTEIMDESTAWYNSLQKRGLIMNIGSRIKTIRKELGLTQKEFAAKIGIHHGQLARYEIGGSTPSIDILTKMADFCEVSIDYFVYGVDKTVAKRSRITDAELLNVLRRVDKLPKTKRDRIKWAVEALLANGQA